MILRQQLIENIEQLSAMDLIIVHNFVQMLTKQTQSSPPRLKTGYLKTREALAICQGNLSEDIIREREERL
ncbi:hypothetical protein [Candidatus Parabeggiatoa sp. HSG14]|uniref:hypothetical protein n=1 Tax=Candidatus Parabeggiatoa sp. HSG14 TaxID=3055593 RepID=UPI0025A88E6A|nr:hypothetical protein [Thiotrichales bacterium HSG14]